MVSEASTSKVMSFQSKFSQRFAFLLEVEGLNEESIPFEYCNRSSEKIGGKLRNWEKKQTKKMSGKQIIMAPSSIPIDDPSFEISSSNAPSPEPNLSPKELSDLNKELKCFSLNESTEHEILFEEVKEFTVDVPPSFGIPDQTVKQLGNFNFF
jgi:hypothetical protein